MDTTMPLSDHADREGLLRVALELAAISEALEGVPVETDDLAYARERVEVLRDLIGGMLCHLDAA